MQHPAIGFQCWNMTVTTTQILEDLETLFFAPVAPVLDGPFQGGVENRQGREFANGQFVDHTIAIGIDTLTNGFNSLNAEMKLHRLDIEGPGGDELALAAKGPHDQIFLDTLYIRSIQRAAAVDNRSEIDALGHQIYRGPRIVDSVLFERLQVFGHFLTEQFNTAGAEQKRRVDIAAIERGKANRRVVGYIDQTGQCNGVGRCTANAANAKFEGYFRVGKYRVTLEACLTIESVDP